MSEKIKPQHLARKAILYIRQSSVYQLAALLPEMGGPHSPAVFAQQLRQEFYGLLSDFSR